MNTIYTVGYQQWTPQQLADVAKRKNAVIVDIRYSPTSMRAEWKREALRARFGTRYQHLPSLGNRNYKGGPIELAAPERAVEPVGKLLERHAVILLCACRDYQTCHRTPAANYLAAALGAPIEHLEPPVETRVGMMKAITLTQPWATLVAIGAKRIETRSWNTSYRGPLAIHAGQGLGPVGGKRGLQETCGTQPFFDALAPTVSNYNRYCDADAIVAALPRSVIVAVATLVNCCPIVMPRDMGAADYTERGMYLEILPGGGSQSHDVTGHEFAFGDYTPGRYAWLLSDVRKLETPIPAKGALGLWDWQPPEGVTV